MDDSLSAEFLIERVEYTLGMYDCTMQQVCSITTDDGSNILMEYERDFDDDEDEVAYYEEARAIFNLDPLDDYEINNTLKCVRCASNTIQVLLFNHQEGICIKIFCIFTARCHGCVRAVRTTNRGNTKFGEICAFRANQIII